MLKSLAKSLYQAAPLKRQAFSLIRPHVRLSPRIYQHLHFEGPFAVDVAPGARFRIYSGGEIVENDLFWSGYGGNWEAKSVQTWAKLAKVSRTIFDIGANTGVYSLAAKAVNPRAEVTAFEPVARIHRRLLRNIRLNDFDVLAIAKAVSDQTGHLTIHDTEDPLCYSASLEVGFAHGDRSYLVEVVRLDDFCADRPKPDLIKLDVEMHEPAAIRGMGEVLKGAPAMLVEILNDEVGTAVQAQIEGLGYDIYRVHEQIGLIQSDTLGAIGQDNWNNLLVRSDTFQEAGLSALLA